MPMAELKDLYPDIRLEAEGCPTAVMDRAIQMTLRDFCRDTWYWLHDIEPLTLVPFIAEAPDTYLYQLDVPDEAEVLAIDSLLLDNLPLSMKTPGWLDEYLPGWRGSSGHPQYFLMLSGKTIRFVPAANEVMPNAVTGQIALIPTPKARTFADGLMDYDAGLAQGALAKLLNMNKPWANPQRAQMTRAVYLEAVSDAKSKVMQRFTDGVETPVQRSWL